MNLKKVTLALSTLCAAAGASATDYPFVMPLAPAAPFFLTVTVAGPSFSDTFSFTAPVGSADVSGSAISVDITPSYNIDSIQIWLFNSSNALIASGTSGAGTQLQNIPVMAGSNYYFTVQGVVPAPFMAGFYTFTAVAAPIPEPETYALMLGGLGLIGFMAARRRRRD